MAERRCFRPPLTAELSRSTGPDSSNDSRRASRPPSADGAGPVHEVEGSAIADASGTLAFPAPRDRNRRSELHASVEERSGRRPEIRTELRCRLILREE